MALILLAVVVLPALSALLLLHPAGRVLSARLLPYLPWPALLVGLLAPAHSADYPAVLLGLELGLEPVARVFLLFTAAIWSAVGFHLRSAGLRVDEYGHRRFLACFLLAMSGNLGVILALDMPGFYLFFALLSFSAYGLIVSETDPQSRRAGRWYLMLALLGELMMLAGFIALAAGRGGQSVAWLLFFGLGIKHGVLPLHVWLPLAHGTASPPASALLSGVLLKAGIIGWLRFLPELEPALAPLSLPVILLGLAAALLAAIAGALQAKPKMLLAYSSISQMGLLTAGLGIALAAPRLWPLLVPVLALFALHHALVKAALFLGVGVSRAGRLGRAVRPALLLLALALAGAPLTGGALVKLWLDEYVGLLPTLPADILAALLPATGVTSTVLMLRFVWLMRAEAPGGEGVGRTRARPQAFLVLSMLALVSPWLLLAQWAPGIGWLALSPYALWKTAWPILLGLLPALLLLRWPLRWHLPPGDLVVLLEVLAARAPRPSRQRLWRQPRWRRQPDWRALEFKLRELPLTGVAFLACLLVFAIVGGALR
jgi:formate hydrogenlyase subunit 3/multisubunit Na+/H+ antiporter MnhD subunit